MSDKELLELAAKAAGIENHGYCTDGFLFVGDGEKGSYDRWNPLKDDALALRLAVKLDMSIEVLSDQGFTMVHSDLTTSQSEQHKNDPYAATRRAIVRAAAEIGRTMG